MSDDLISRKALLGTEQLLMTDIVKNNPTARYILEQVLYDIENTPTAYDVDKVVQSINEIGKRYCNSVKCDKNCEDCEHGCLMRAIINAVKSGGVAND